METNYTFTILDRKHTFNIKKQKNYMFYHRKRWSSSPLPRGIQDLKPILANKWILTQSGEGDTHEDRIFASKEKLATAKSFVWLGKPPIPFNTDLQKSGTLQNARPRW